MNQNLNPKVIICVSTYNGEKYLKEQIESPYEYQKRNYVDEFIGDYKF